MTNVRQQRHVLPFAVRSCLVMTTLRTILYVSAGVTVTLLPPAGSFVWTPTGSLWVRVAGQYVGGCHVCCDYQGSADSSYLSGEKCKNMFLVEALVLVATAQLKNARVQSQMCLNNIAQQLGNSSWFVFAKTFLMDLTHKCYFCPFCFESLR